MKLKKLLAVLLTLATVISMITVCSVPASARATAYVNLSVEPRGSGQIRFNSGEWGGSIGQRFWIEEETIQIEAKTDPGYKFVKWGSPVNSSQNTVKLTGLENGNIYYIDAYFEKIPDPEYNITVTNGSAIDYRTGSSVKSSVAGRKIGITASPAPQSGMVFDKWVVKSGNITLANAKETTTTFTMPANAVTIEATYKQSDPNAGKKVSLYFIQGDKYGKGEYELQAPYGATFEFPPNPFGTVKGYEFTGWHDADTKKAYKPGDKATATETAYYVADYKGLPVTVHFEIYDSKTTSGKMSDVQVERGTYYTLPECTFTPSKGYVFDEWMMYGGAGSKVEVKNDITIWAKFKEDPNYSRYCIITFDNGYTDSRHDTYTEKVLKNSTYKLPRCSFFRAETDKKFKCWDMGEVGKTIEIGDENEITITAQWVTAGDLSDCTVTVNYGDEVKDRDGYLNYMYRNTPITPVYEVKTVSGYVLKEGVDFTAEYSNNVNAAEKALIILTGKGNFTGTKKEYFTINPLPVYTIMSDTLSLYDDCSIEFYIGAVYPNGKQDLKKFALPNNVKNSIESLSLEYPGYRSYYGFDYTGEEIKVVLNAVLNFNGGQYPLKISDFKLKSGKGKIPSGYLETIYADSDNVKGSSKKDSAIEQFWYYISLNSRPVIKSITKVENNKYKVNYNRNIKNSHCYVHILVTYYDEKGNTLGAKDYTVKNPGVNAKVFKLKYRKAASIGVQMRYLTYYDQGYSNKDDNRNYARGDWSNEKKYQIKKVPETVDIRVPLKTALKRENEIAASDTRKADEAGLAPG